jgi:hypothetical protein
MQTSTRRARSNPAADPRGHRRHRRGSSGRRRRGRPPTRRMDSQYEGITAPTRTSTRSRAAGGSEPSSRVELPSDSASARLPPQCQPPRCRRLRRHRSLRFDFDLNALSRPLHPKRLPLGEAHVRSIPTGRRRLRGCCCPAAPQGPPWPAHLT